MSKRRNKNNKGQNAGKGGKQAKPASPAVSAAPAEAAELAEDTSALEFPPEDLSAMLASSGMADEAQPDAELSQPDSAGEASSDPAAGESAAVEDAVGSDGSAGEDLANSAADAHDAMPQVDLDESAGSPSSDSIEPVVARSPIVEFEDASAALAQAIRLEPADVREASSIRSIPIPDVSEVDLEMGGDVASAWDSTSADEAEPMGSEQSPAQVEDAATAGPVGKGRKKLKLNKLQKHTRSPSEAEAPAPEPEPAPVVRRVPREPRIAAFSKLTEYQRLSLAHVPGLPEESDVPGHWRGVGFGIGGRRLVSAFDEVVEIMRLPQITHVRGTQPWMLGVANVRGTLLPVVDLKQFLEGERTVMHEGQRVLVVRQAGGNVAVLIDQLFGQRSFNDSQKSDLAAASGTRYDHFIKQFYRVGDNDWGVFSMSMLTRTPEFRQAAA